MNEPLTNPFVGPRTFEQDDEHLFFGRDKEARQLLSLVIAERLVLFYAQSGAGKSSLLNTRLRPGLEEEDFHVLPTARVGVLPEGVTKVENIFVFNLIASLEIEVDIASHFADLDLPGYLNSYRESHQEVDEFGNEKARVLIIDQFEEIVTTHLERWRDRVAFFKQLADAMTADPLLWIVLTMREDHVAAVEPYGRYLPGGMRKRYHMQRMMADAALKAIEEPARNAGRPFTRPAARQLVDDLRQIRMQTGEEGEETAPTAPGEFIEPVQLQVVCFQLWANLNAQAEPPAEIGPEDLRQYGNVDDALSQFYESAIDKVLRQTGGSELELREWFEKQLITEAATRGTVYQGPDATAGMPNATVQQLANQYLLRAERRAGGIWYEIVHDRFVTPILQANQAWRARQGPLFHAARDWDASGRPKGKLIIGAQLESMKEMMGTRKLEALLTDFLAECEKAEAEIQEKEAQHQRELALERQRAAEQARRVRVTRWLLGLSVGLLVVAIFSASSAVRNGNEAAANAAIAITSESVAQTREAEAVESARIAEDALADAEAAKDELEIALAEQQLAERQARARLLDSEANDLYFENPLLGIWMSLEGLTVIGNDDLETRNDLFRSSLELLRTGRVNTFGNDIVSLTAHPDNPSLLVVERDEGQIEIWHSEVDGPLAQLIEPAEDIFYNSDGSLLIADYRNAPGELYSTDTGVLLSTLSDNISNEFGVLFSPEGIADVLIVNYEDRPAEIWSTPIGDTPIIELEDNVQAVLFSANEAFFLVDYEDVETPDELWAADGPRVVARLNGDVYAAAFSPVENTIVIDYQDTDLRDEVRATADGQVIAELRDDIAHARFNLDGSVLYVDYLTTGQPDELISGFDDSVVITPLQDDTTKVEFSPGGGWLAVDYAGEVDGEVLNTADTSVRIALESDNFFVDFADDDSFIIVDYNGADGELISLGAGNQRTPLTSGSFSVDFSPDETFFQLNYFGDTPTELRSTATGAVIVSDFADISYSPRADFFILTYDDGSAELWRAADASLVARLAEELFTVEFSPDEALLVVHDTSSGSDVVELWRTEDGTRLAAGLADVIFSQFTPDYVVIYQDPKKADVLLSSADDSKIITFEYKVAGVFFEPTGTNFSVIYQETEIPAELRNVADGAPAVQFDGSNITGVAFSDDGSLFHVFHEDGSASVYRTADNALLGHFGGDVDSIVYNNGAASFQQTRRFDNQLENRWTFYADAGDVIDIRIDGTDQFYITLYDANGIRTVNSTDFIINEVRDVTLPVSGRYTLYSYIDGAEDYTLSVNLRPPAGAEPAAGSTTATNFVVFFADDSIEVWDTIDNVQLANLSSVNSVSFSPDSDQALFIVEHENRNQEVRRRQDGDSVTQLGATIADITFSPIDSTSFIVHAGDGTAYLHRTADGALLSHIIDENSRDNATILNADGDSPLFGLRYTDKPTELYNTSDGRWLLDLPGDVYYWRCLPELVSEICVFAYTDEATSGQGAAVLPEMRRPDDGALLDPLTDYVVDITPGPNNAAAVFIVDYVTSPSEIRLVSDGTRLATLQPDLLNISFSDSAQTPIIIVNYADETAELRQIDDGTVMASLDGTVEELIHLPESTLFIVNYYDKPAEIRDSANHDFTLGLADIIQSVSFSPDPEGHFLAITYRDAPIEIRISGSGELLTTLDSEVDVRAVDFGPSATTALFLVKYADGQTEIRRTSDGTPFLTLTDPVIDIVLSSDPEAQAFVVRYVNTVPEVRSLIDGNPIDLGADVLSIVFDSLENPTAFAIYYVDAPVQIRRMVDASSTVTLTNSVERIYFGGDDENPRFIVDYYDGSGALYDVSSGSRIITLTAEIGLVTLDDRLDGIFLVDYQTSNTLAELRRFSDGQTLPAVLSYTDVAALVFSPDETLYHILYTNDAADAFWTAGNQLIERFPGEIRDFKYDVGAGLTTVIQDEVTTSSGDFWTFYGREGTIVTIDMRETDGFLDTYLTLLNQNGIELTSNDDSGTGYNSLITEYRLPYSGLYTINARGYAGNTGYYILYVTGFYSSATAIPEEPAEPEPTTKFAVIYESDLAEVWGLDPERRIVRRSNVAEISFSSDMDMSVIIVRLKSNKYELYTDEGSPITGAVVDDMTRVIFSPDSSYFVVVYEDAGNHSEIFRTADGRHVATFEGPVQSVTFSPDASGRYVVVAYPGDRQQVWSMQTETPHKLADLGENLVEYVFDVANENLVVRYENNDVYLLDLGFLETLSHIETPRELLREACAYLLPSRTIDEAILAEHLGDNEREACQE